MKRVRKASAFLGSFLHYHTGFYIILLAAFLAGLIVSVVFCVQAPEETVEELSLYIDDFFQNMQKSGADSLALLKTGCVMHGCNFMFLIVCALMLIGIPLVAVFAAVKGFMHGFTIFLMMRIYGFKTLLFILLGMLPHYVVLVPCYLVACLVSMRYAGSLYQGSHELKANTLQLVGSLCILFVIAIMATLLQAYVEPVLIRLISGLYLAH